MAVLVVADHDNTHLRDNTNKTITAAQRLSPEVDVLVLGSGCRAAAEEAASVQGVRRALLADREDLDKVIAETVADLILSLMDGYDAVLAPASSAGKNFAPRVAAKLDVAPLSDVIEIVDADTFVRPIYAGNALQTVQSSDPKKVITVRPTAFKAAPIGGGSGVVEEVQPTPPAARTRFEREEIVKTERPELGAAKIVVSGGRALGSSEEFERVIVPLADLLGAAVGASRAAVDAGYAPNDYQVGQTGKVVAPDLYIAVGISGAIQHLAGMKDSKVIVAINKDGDAPIFSVADYGVVGDYRTVVPQIMDELKQVGR
ncbi:MAG: electron transfer flavoprotein subunit alpha/FixB family protein [Proteobacteria bacterium]|nr:electron transfer flavoprotein subunit alpha/FixB family protein [Pseudomonadota bacterium]